MPFYVCDTTNGKLESFEFEVSAYDAMEVFVRRGIEAEKENQSDSGLSDKEIEDRVRSFYSVTYEQTTYDQARDIIYAFEKELDERNGAYVSVDAGIFTPSTILLYCDFPTYKDKLYYFMREYEEQVCRSIDVEVEQEVERILREHERSSQHR